MQIISVQILYKILKNTKSITINMWYFETAVQLERQNNKHFL